MTDHDYADAIVIGAGVVGLAIARALAAKGLWTIVLESEGDIGTGISSRNSEVIHAGLYYPTGSLKALLCVEGRRKLYDYAETKGFDALKIGKLVVASEETQEEALFQLMRRAKENGVEALSLLSQREVANLEPEVRASQAIYSRETGIVDSHAFMVSLLGDLEDAGGAVAFNTPFLRAFPTNGARLCVVTGGFEQITLECGVLVNASGIEALDVSGTVEGFDHETLPDRHYAKGNYFALSGMKSPFRRLIYPLPNDAGLGIHATLDLGGQVRFGPDVEWVTELDFEPNVSRLSAFEAAIRCYYPALPDGALYPIYAGIRPKIVGEGEPAADFRIDTEKDHGLPGFINLMGIESPGLTSALAIADYVARKI